VSASFKPVVQISRWHIDGEFLFGNVQDHPRFEKDYPVRTSRIQRRDGDMVETKNTIYKLIGEEFVLADAINVQGSVGGSNE
jgi:hypothetical protein